MRWRLIACLMVGWFCAVGTPASAQISDRALALNALGQIDYEKQDARERKMLEYLLSAEEWHYRCFGLFRLERFKGEPVGVAITKALSDEAWQVR